MKQELQDKLVEILSAIQAATGKASDFAMEQLPDIVQQYVAYGRITGVLILILQTIVIAILVWGVRAYEKQADFLGSGFGYFFGGLAVLVLGFSWFSVFQTTLLVWIAPKVWLIKELAELIK